MHIKVSCITHLFYNFSRSDASYAIYKNLRGTPPYFAAQKKRAIAMVRQLGISID
jgi:hypothetical protein